mgnify:FL=1
MGMVRQRKAPELGGEQGRGTDEDAFSIGFISNASCPVNFHDALAEMATYAQWVIWRKGKVKEDGKFPKFPLCPSTGEIINGSHESGEYLKKATTYEEALSAQKKFGASGLGYVLSKDDPFVGVDVDGCLDNGGDPGPLIDIVEQFDSYTEVSPSGKGIRIFCKGSLPEGAKKKSGNFEIYESGRFLTVTGNVYGEPKPVRDAQEAVNWYCATHTGIDETHASPTSERPQKSRSEVTKDLDRAEEALKHIPPDDYQTWLEMGMALHSTGAGDFAFQVWDQWSRSSEKYDERDQNKTWQSIKGRDHGLTMGTLFHLAKEHGWTHKGSSQQDEISILCLTEIAKEQHPDNPVIDSLLDEKESLLICGQSGIGKSLLGLLLSTSLGDPPLNGIWGKFHIPRPVSTLLIQSENSRKATSKRLQAMIKNNPNLKKGFDRAFIPLVREDVRYVGEFREKGFQHKVMEMVDAIGAQCLIIDPLISYHGGDENDNSEMRRSLDALTELMDRTGAASILFHHLGKASARSDFNKVFSGRGASAIGDWAANILTLGIAKTEGPEAVIECHHHKARNFSTVPPFYLRRTQDLQFHLCDKPGGQKEQAEILAVIQALKGMDGKQAESQTQLCNAITASTDWSDKKAQRAIQKAVKAGQVVQTPHPTHKKRQCYTLTFEGELTGYANDPGNDPTLLGTVETEPALS